MQINVPNFKFQIKNISKDSIKIPEEYIITVKERPENNVNAEIIYKGKGPVPSNLTCNIDPSWGINDEGRIGPSSLILSPGKRFLFDSNISCYDFSEIGEYQIRFILDKGWTGLYGQTAWIKIKVIK